MSENPSERDVQNPEVSYTVLTRLMSLAFVEIRASEKLEVAQMIADIFHNLPGALATGKRSAEDIFDDLRARAARHGCEQKIVSLLRTAAKS